MEELHSVQEKQAAYRLINIKGVGAGSCLKLTEYAGSARKALELPEKEVREILNQRIAETFLRGRENEIQTDIAQLEKKNAFRFIPYTAPEYPEKLRYISNPPFALYVRGKLPEVHRPSVAIIGARACSEYGKTVARRFGMQLGAMGVQIISGMAKGIDGIAQQGALDGGGETYGVLGSGVDVIYPPENGQLYHNILEKGGIISEYPPGMEAQSALFPQRNRIISGLADLLLVVEARKRSGTYITVTQALEQGKEVFVVPGRITDTLSEGCNYLLTQGAGVATNPEVIAEAVAQLSSYGYISGRKLESSSATDATLYLSDGETQKTLKDHILSVLEITPMELEVLYHRLQAVISLTMEELLLELTKMQVTGMIIATGNYYRLTMHL